MKVMKTGDLEKLMRQFPEGGIVFAEYKPDALTGPLQVTDGAFGATCVVPWHENDEWDIAKEWRAEVYDYDWSIGEHYDEDLFMVFSPEEIEMMIGVLRGALEKHGEIGNGGAEARQKKMEGT